VVLRKSGFLPGGERTMNIGILTEIVADDFIKLEMEGFR